MSPGWVGSHPSSSRVSSLEAGHAGLARRAASGDRTQLMILGRASHFVLITGPPLDQGG